MLTMYKKRISTETLVLAAVMTALVIVFQLLATFTAFFGPFSTAIALIPIVIGAVLCGAGVGAWLGFTFGMVVLLSGGANLFLTFSIVGTWVTVLAKGTLCGFAAGLCYKLLKKLNHYVGIVAAALICPIVNTGVFMLGSAIFFLNDASGIAALVGSKASGMAVFVALALANFLFEIGMSVVLSPAILRIVDLGKKKKA